MAFATTLEHEDRAVRSVHEPKLHTYCIYEEGGAKYIQLMTYPSEASKAERHASQVFQFGEAVAEELLKIILSTYPRLDQQCQPQ